MFYVGFHSMTNFPRLFILPEFHGSETNGPPPPPPRIFVIETFALLNTPLESDILTDLNLSIKFDGVITVNALPYIRYRPISRSPEPGMIMTVRPFPES